MTSVAFDRASVRVPKTAELVATHVRQRIVVGDLSEGEALPPESALMDEFGISRPTLREAFRILESEGLITIRRGARGGARVQLPSADVAARYAGLVLQHRGATLADVMEARVIVEAPAARMLAVRRDRASIARKLEAKLESLTAEDAAHFHEFNALVIELTGNETLLLLTTMLEHISQAAAISFDRLHPLNEPDSYVLSKRAHRTRARLIELIRAGDADAAEDLWREHLTEAGRVLTRGAGANLLDLFS